jgi:hypothetical protein
MPCDEAKIFASMRDKLRAAIDKEWIKAGATPEELEISRRLGDLFACELAAGRTPAEIEASWEGKSAEEILCTATEPK